MEPAFLILLGSAIGVLTGILPGFHVNTLAAIGFAIAPTAGVGGAILLLSVGTVHTIVNILPGTYLGVPEDDGVSMLPAHQMLLTGRGRQAVAVSVGASTMALVLAATASVLYLPLLRRGLPLLDAVAVPAVIAAMVGMWWLDLRGRWNRTPGVLATSAAAMVVGHLSMRVPMQPWVGVPASGLLPLLAGLFGGAGLTFALQGNRIIPTQAPAGGGARPMGSATAGTFAACITAVLPGLTSAVAASFVPGVRRHPARAVASLSAVNTAHATFALVVWMGLGRIRTGLAAATDAWAPTQWTGLLPEPGPSKILATVLAAGAVGAVATLALDAVLAPRIHRIPAKMLAGSGLTLLVASVAILTGWGGLLTFALAMLVGRLPLHLGVRRVHLVAALMLPIIMTAW